MTVIGSHYVDEKTRNIPGGMMTKSLGVSSCARLWFRRFGEGALATFCSASIRCRIAHRTALGSARRHVAARSRGVAAPPYAAETLMRNHSSPSFRIATLAPILRPDSQLLSLANTHLKK